jgi:hypothetical protein
MVERVESKVDQLDTKLDALSESPTLIRERLASLEAGPQESGQVALMSGDEHRMAVVAVSARESVRGLAWTNSKIWVWSFRTTTMLPGQEQAGHVPNAKRLP